MIDLNTCRTNYDDMLAEQKRNMAKQQAEEEAANFLYWQPLIDDVFAAISEAFPEATYCTEPDDGAPRRTGPRDFTLLYVPDSRRGGRSMRLVIESLNGHLDIEHGATWSDNDAAYKSQLFFRAPTRWYASTNGPIDEWSLHVEQSISTEDLRQAIGALMAGQASWREAADKLMATKIDTELAREAAIQKEKASKTDAPTNRRFWSAATADGQDYGALAITEAIHELTDVANDLHNQLDSIATSLYKR